jgi:hypothetical protein
MELQEIAPPYNINCIDSDSQNPNTRDEELWNSWLRELDFIQLNYKKDLVSTEDLVAIWGHRGVRIGEVTSLEYDWYYNVVCGYKIVKNEQEKNT